MKYLSLQSKSNIDKVFMNNLLSLPTVFISILLGNEISIATSYDPTSLFLFVLFINLILSFGISFSTFWALSNTSATTVSILGAINKVPLTIISLFLLNDTRSTIGLTWSIGGINRIILTYLQKIALVAGVVYSISKQLENHRVTNLVKSEV